MFCVNWQTLLYTNECDLGTKVVFMYKRNKRNQSWSWCAFPVYVWFIKKWLKRQYHIYRIHKHTAHSQTTHTNINEQYICQQVYNTLQRNAPMIYMKAIFRAKGSWLHGMLGHETHDCC